MNLKTLKKKLTNTKTVVAIFSLVVLILTAWGVNVPVQELDVTVKALCTIGVLLGVMNDKGMTTDKWNK